MFDYEVPAVVRAMRNLTRGVFEQLQITSPMYVDQMVAYTQRILRGVALNKHKAVLLECKQSAKDLEGDKCTLGDFKVLSIEDFWTWDKSYGLAYDIDVYLGMENCV